MSKEYVTKKEVRRILAGVSLLALAIYGFISLYTVDLSLVPTGVQNHWSFAYPWILSWSSVFIFGLLGVHNLVRADL